jgi:hypothetical protein
MLRSPIVIMGWKKIFFIKPETYICWWGRLLIINIQKELHTPKRLQVGKEIQLAPCRNHTMYALVIRCNFQSDASHTNHPAIPCTKEPVSVQIPLDESNWWNKLMSSIQYVVPSGEANDPSVHDNTPIHCGSIHRGHQREERKDKHGH